MGVKRGPYQTKKQLLQNECTKRNIKYAVRWGTKELQAALDGKRPATVKRINTGDLDRLRAECRKKGIEFLMGWSARQLTAALDGRKVVAVCMPPACTCGKPIDPVVVSKKEQRRDERMHTKTKTHHFDGVIFCRNICECGQSLVIRLPVKARAIKCECKRPAIIWDKNGEGTCSYCATR